MELSDLSCCFFVGARPSKHVQIGEPLDMLFVPAFGQTKQYILTTFTATSLLLGDE